MVGLSYMKPTVLLVCLPLAHDELNIVFLCVLIFLLNLESCSFIFHMFTVWICFWKFEPITEQFDLANVLPWHNLNSGSYWVTAIWDTGQILSPSFPFCETFSKYNKSHMTASNTSFYPWTCDLWQNILFYGPLHVINSSAEKLKCTLLRGKWFKPLNQPDRPKVSNLAVNIAHISFLCKTIT